MAGRRTKVSTSPWVCRGGSIGVNRRVWAEEKTVIPFRSATSAINPWICWTPEGLVVKIERKIPVAAPHPPSPAAGSPLSRGAGEGLCGCTSNSTSPALRERVPSASRRVRVPRYQLLGSHHWYQIHLLWERQAKYNVFRLRGDAGTETKGAAYGSGLQYMSWYGWLGRVAQSGCREVVDTASRPVSAQ
jgi:hypothetical protein